MNILSQSLLSRFFFGHAVHNSRMLNFIILQDQKTES